VNGRDTLYLIIAGIGIGGGLMSLLDVARLFSYADTVASGISVHQAKVLSVYAFGISYAILAAAPVVIGLWLAVRVSEDGEGDG